MLWGTPAIITWPTHVALSAPFIATCLAYVIRGSPVIAGTCPVSYGRPGLVASRVECITPIFSKTDCLVKKCEWSFEAQCCVTFPTKTPGLCYKNCYVSNELTVFAKKVVVFMTKENFVLVKVKMLDKWVLYHHKACSIVNPTHSLHFG